MKNIEFERIYRMLEIAHTESAVFPPTILYNEGWMLRILLSLHFAGIECLPFTVQSEARWFSEAQISSPFLPRFRGDPLAEQHTHLDGAIGHFDFQSGTKTGLILTPDSTQFVVTEAKMFSHLSKGTKNAKYYDQAARTIACIAWAIRLSNRPVQVFETLAFYVLAPQVEIAGGTFSVQVKKSSIREKVDRRISEYSDDEGKYEELQSWHKDFFIPVIELIDIRCISWESIIDMIDDISIQNFYNRCLEFNASTRS